MKASTLWVGVLLASWLVGCADPYEEGLKDYEAGRWKEAIEHFEHVSAWSADQHDVKPLVRTAYFNIGKEAYEQQRWDEALEYLRKIKPQDSNYEAARDLIGCSFYQMGQAAYQRRDLAEARRLLNVVRTGCSQFDKAHELISQVNREYEDSAASQP